MQAKDALFQFCYLSRISLLFLSSCFNSNPRISSPILCPFLGPSIWISVPRKGCSASRGAGRAPRLTIQLAKARWGCLFSCAVGRNFLPTVQRPRSKLSKRSTLHPQLHLHLWLSIWCITRTQNPTLLLRLQRLETKASEVHSLRAGKPRGLSRKLSLRGLVGGPPAEGKDLEWTAMVHSEARDSAWGWSTQSRGLWPQRKENCPACWIGHKEDVVFKLILEGQVWCDRWEQGLGIPAPGLTEDSEQFRGLGFTFSTPAPDPPSSYIWEDSHHPPGHWRAEGHCGESRKNKQHAAWTTQRLSNSGIRISQEAG